MPKADYWSLVARGIRPRETYLQLPDYYRDQRVKREVRRLEDNQKSFFWLAHALGLSRDFDFKSLLLNICIDGSASYYHPPRVIQKTEGGKRVIITPKADLRMVQRRIHQLLMRTFPRDPNTFGFMGGSCQEVAKRHAPYASTLKFDARDAFFQVSWPMVRSSVRSFPIEKGQRSPGFFKCVAYWIAKLCTYNVKDSRPEFQHHTSFLAQGAPTSPICFHLAYRRLDAKLARIAERVGGIYSRYADNYYFSVPTPEISDKLMRIITCDARKHIPIHKLRRVNQNELCRILGYNVQDGHLSNSKDYRRKLRGALYVLRTRIERGLPYDEAHHRVEGLMQFTINLPPDLQKAYDHCRQLIADS